MGLSKRLGILIAVVLSLGLTFGLVSSASATPFSPGMQGVRMEAAGVVVGQPAAFVSAFWGDCSSWQIRFHRNTVQVANHAGCAYIEVYANGQRYIASTVEAYFPGSRTILKGQLTTNGMIYSFVVDTSSWPAEVGLWIGPDRNNINTMVFDGPLFGFVYTSS